MGQLNQFNDSLIELFILALHISIVSSKGMKLRPPPWLAGLVASGLEPIGSSVEAQLACGCLFIDLGGSVTSASTYLHHPPLSSLPHSLTLLPDITVLALIPPKWLRFLSHFLNLIAKKKQKKQKKKAKVTFSYCLSDHLICAVGAVGSSAAIGCQPCFVPLTLGNN